MPTRFHTLVIDLDGTLLGPESDVSDANRRAIDRARDAGIQVIIATGRALVESRVALQAINHDGLIVAAGGSLLSDVRTGQTLMRHVMPRDIVTEASQTLIEHGHKVLVLKDSHSTGYDYLAVGPGQLNPVSEWWLETLSVQVRYAAGIDEDEHPDDTVRAGVVAAANCLAPLATLLRDSLGERAFLQHWPAVTETPDNGGELHLLEIFNPRVNKWTMIEAYCDEAELDPSGVVAIGDGLNDIEMVANAGLGIAMANADPRVRDVAKRQTGTNREDGVAHAVDQLLRGSW